MQKYTQIDRTSQGTISIHIQQFEPCSDFDKNKATECSLESNLIVSVYSFH